MGKYLLKLGKLENFDLDLPYITNIKDRYEHAYIIGKTGTGKSVLMEHMANYDISQGISTIYIDPKGESCRRLYSLAPDKSKIKYISIKNPMVINPLNKEGYDIDDIIAEFVQILDILVTLTASNPESTVLMREIIGMALRCFNKEQKNLAYLVDFLLYKEIRQKHLADISTPKYITYWREFDATERNGYPRNKDKIESAKRVASRLLEISEGKMKDIVHGENELYIQDLVNKGESLLVDTSRMSRNSRIYLSNLIVYSVLSYCEYYEGDKKPLIVYVDELKTIISPLFTELLARSRGKKVGFVLAHQNINQLTPSEVSGIMGNTKTYILFNCGLDEADKYAPMLDVKPKELFGLEKYHAWVRIGNKNTLVKTFKPIMETVPDLPEEFEKLKDSNLSPDGMIDHFFLSNDWIVL
ncbi:MAG: helicase HerA domain-containing protein [Ignavibacteriaceae bacterium]